MFGQVVAICPVTRRHPTYPILPEVHVRQHRVQTTEECWPLFPNGCVHVAKMDVAINLGGINPARAQPNDFPEASSVGIDLDEASDVGPATLDSPRSLPLWALSQNGLSLGRLVSPS